MSDAPVNDYHDNSPGAGTEIPPGQTICSSHRSKSFLAAEAVSEFLEINEWQIEEIKNALKEADAEDFSSDHEIRSVFNIWGVGGD